MPKKIRRILRKKGKALSKKNRAFEIVYSFFIRNKRRATYNKYARLRIEEKTIAYDCFMGTRCCDSPKAIYDYMQENEKYADYKHIWCLRGKAKSEYEYLSNNHNTTIVAWGSKEYYKALATSKFWIANTRIPSAIKKRDQQVYVQCWHGTPLKKLFCDIDKGDPKKLEINKRVISEDVKRYTYMISPSRFFSNVAKSAFNLSDLQKENVLIETGYPRNDSITNRLKERETIKKKFDIPSSSKVLLYAPTYREDQNNNGSGYAYNEYVDFDSLLQRINENITILFRAHYYVSSNFDFEKYKGRIIDVSSHKDINELYIVSDMLLTDYSSVFFDYGILRRPIMFYMPDLEYYRDSLRGLYLDLSELPGPVAKTQAELETMIMECDEWWKSKDVQDKYAAFSERFTYLEDGHATDRVVEIVFDK